MARRGGRVEFCAETGFFVRRIRSPIAFCYSVDRPRSRQVPDPASDRVCRRHQADKVRVVAYSARVRLETLSLPGRYSKKESEMFHEQIACEAFGRIVRRWLVAALLAKVGVLQFSDILVTANRNLWRRWDDFHGLSREHLENAQQMKWPPLKSLSIRAVWRWLQKVPGFNNDFGLTEVGRAIAAFTHLFPRRGPTAFGEVLLWALLGLEALYTRGTTELGS